MIACSVRRTRRRRRRHRVREPTMPPRMIIGGHFLACMVWRSETRLGTPRSCPSAHIGSAAAALPPPPGRRRKNRFQVVQKWTLMHDLFSPAAPTPAEGGCKKNPYPPLCTRLPSHPAPAAYHERTNHCLGGSKKINERLTDYAPPR